MEYTEIDLNKVCRTCKNQALEMKSLYYKDSENAKENPRVDEMLIACTSVQIDTEDNLPKFICQSCFVQLKNAYTFKEQCEKTDVFMRNYLQTMKSIKVEDGLADVEFTTSEVVCDIKPLRLGNESVDKDVTDEIIDNSKVHANQRVENEDVDYDQIIDNNVTLYKCRMCPKYFYILQGLRSHQRLHAGKTVKCRYCDKSFVHLNHLRQHESSHAKPKLHILKIGNKTDDIYENPNRVKNHVTTHKGKKVNISDVGNKTSLGDGNKNPVLPTFSDTEDVHVMVNVVNNVIIYKCIVCSKEFYTVEGLKCHKRLHIDKTFKCKQCDRTYTRLSHLQRHQLSHGKRKMYVCNICNKSFNRYEHLKRHLTTHLKTRPFSCPICKRGFNRVQRLEKHVTICKGKRMYVCDICNSAFRREDSMQVHKREHEHKGAVLPTLENLNNIQEYYTKVEVNDETKAFSDKENFNIVGKNIQADNNDQVRNDEIAPIINDYPNEHPSEVLLQKVKIEEELSLVSGNDAGEKQASGTDNGNDYGSNDSGHHKYKPTNQSTPIVKRDKGKPGKYPVGTGGKPKGSKALKRRRILQRTIKTKGGEIERLEIKSFQCEMCKKSFSRKERLQKHIKLLHLNSAAFKCDPCQAVFSREEDLAKHKTCKHNSRETLVNNLRKDSQTNVHIGENKLQCKTCGKTFLSKSHLTEHTKFHSDSMKKFLCSECGQKFIRRDFLAIHMRRHRGEKPFKCKFCAYSFTRLADLTAHEKNHTGEKTHLCALCGRGFGRAYYLTLHMRRHTGEKPYRCSYCDAAFVQGSDLKVHVRRHTGERFSCELCSRTFLTASSLTQHKRVVHGLNIVNDRRSEVAKQLDLPPATLTLSGPIMITNSLASDPLQINQ